MRDFKSLLRTQDEDFIARSLISYRAPASGGEQIFQLRNDSLEITLLYHLSKQAFQNSLLACRGLWTIG